MSTRSVGLTLDAGTTYVTGTVNGTVATFTLTGTNLWTATVDRSDDDIYDIVVEAVGAGGVTTTVSVRLYYGLHLIRDRSASDVALETDKGFYMATDLNRVEAAVSYVSERLTSAGYTTGVDTVKTDWRRTDLPELTDIDRYLGNITRLRAVLPVFETTPEVPESMNQFGWTGANAIEQILYDVDYLITQMVSAYRYAGESYCGEV